MLLRHLYSLLHGPRGPSSWAGEGGVLPSRAFPEPATHSYGAPGVEFMGLHRENNAVVQIHFLPGQVRRPPHPLTLTSAGRGGERQAFASPGSGSDGRAWDHPPFPSCRSQTTLRGAKGLLVPGLSESAGTGWATLV